MKTTTRRLVSFLATVALCLTMLLPAAMPVLAQADTQVNITAYGSPIVCCTNPLGAANKNLGVIVDGVMPDVGGSLEQYYGTFGETAHDGGCYYGVEFVDVCEFTGFVYQTGMHWGDGGWFVGDSIRLQVKQDGEWVEVISNQYSVTPDLPQSTVTEDMEDNFASYTFTFQSSIEGTGLRIVGQPGGSALHTSCGEVAVYAAEEPDWAIQGVDVTSYGSPLCCVSDPQGGGSRNLGVTCDGVFPDVNGTGDQEYDTWGGTAHEGDCYFGMQFDSTIEMTAFVYQTGKHYPDGGWFVAEGLRLQVRQNGEWVDAADYSVLPAIPANTATQDLEGSFAIYTFKFASPVETDGVRIAGAPAGHISCGEMAVYATEVPVSSISGVDVTSYGTPLACVSDPKGQGNKDIGVTCDGVFPATSGGANQQYDTWGGTAHEGDCYFGMQFDSTIEMTAFIYQTGTHWPDGGWFVAEGLKLQVKQNGAWVDVTDYSVTPVIPANTATEDLEGSFAKYTFRFDSVIETDGVRIAGTPAGHISCAEMAVYAIEAPEREPVAETNDVNITSHGTPLACVSDPKGQGNKDIGVTCDGVFPATSGGANQQYDTWGGTAHEGDCYFGMEFDGLCDFTRFVYQTGTHWPDGGWFVTEGLKLQVKQNGAWVDVTDYSVTPTIPANTATEDLEGSFATYTFSFAFPIEGEGIRIAGTPAGHISCAEMAVYATQNPITDRTSIDLTEYSTAISCCDERKSGAGAGSKDIGVIIDGAVLTEETGVNGTWYDTYGEMEHDGDCWFGVEYPSNVRFTSLYFQTGRHFGDGGWFIGETVRIQVKKNGEWVDVEYAVSPAIPNNTVHSDEEGSFAEYTFTLTNYEAGTAIRVIGAPGGHTSCGEIAAYGFGYEEKYIDYEGKLTHDGLLDRIKGARLGEAVGYLWGQKISGVHNTAMVAETKMPAAPAGLSDMYLSEDIYGEIPFLKAYLANPDSTVEELAASFAASGGNYTHAAKQAIENLNAGIAAKEAGNYLNNQHYNDYNWAALSNFYGLMYPGNVNLAAEKAFETGHIMSYGDGAYAGAFLAALQAAAFTSDSVEEMVDRAIAVIPAESQFGAVIREVRDFCNGSNGMSEVYDIIQLGWYEYESCPDSPGEAKTTVFTNAAFVLAALLIGNGDFNATAKAVVSAGQLSGSTASSALSILGTLNGYEKIPAKFKNALSNVTGTYSGTDWTFDTLLNQSFTLAESYLQAQGATYDEINGWQISAEEVRALTLEQTPELPVLTLSSLITGDKTVTLTADAFALSFTRITYAWDFGDGTTGEGDSPVHKYPDYGTYTATCTATDKNGNARTQQLEVHVLPPLDGFDEIITTATSPTGLGNKDISILYDGAYVDAENTEASYGDQYDSFGTTPDENGYTWFGYTYRYQHTFNGLLFQEGVHDSTGGFIPNGTMKVQVLTDEGWVDVANMTVSPSYPNSSKTQDFGDSFEIFTIAFDAIDGYGIRLMGSGGFFGLAELAVYGVLNMTNEEKLADVNGKLASVPDADSITASDVKTVNTARTAYDDLGEELKSQVEGYDRLTAAEAKIAEHTENAGKVDEQILALPALDAMTNDDKDAVEAARAAYDALSDGAKTFVAQLEALEKAEQRISELSITFGDINGDDNVNASDALLALQHSVKLITLKDGEFTAADVDVNNKVDASDALLILQYSVKLIDSLPQTK